MAQQDKRIYRGRRPWRTAVAVLLTLLAAALVLMVLTFFFFRRYIVYSTDGLRLEVPWLEERQQPEEEL